MRADLRKGVYLYRETDTGLLCFIFSFTSLFQGILAALVLAQASHDKLIQKLLNHRKDNLIAIHIQKSFYVFIDLMK